MRCRVTVHTIHIMHKMANPYMYHHGIRHDRYRGMFNYNVVFLTFLDMIKRLFKSSVLFSEPAHELCQKGTSTQNTEGSYI